MSETVSDFSDAPPGRFDLARYMTLRDYFAAQALSLAAKWHTGPGGYESLASRAYVIADALLAARDK